MNRLTLILIVGAIATVIGLAYFQSQMQGMQNHGHIHHGGYAAESAAMPSDDPVISAYREANGRMHTAMAISLTGNADVDFMRGMIPHHQGAIDMARIVLEHGSDPEVRKLAETVISAQEAEIQVIREWLAARGQ